MVSSKGLAPGGFHADGPWWPSRWTGGNIDPGQAPTVSSLRRRGEQYQTAPARTARSAATGQAVAPPGILTRRRTLTGRAILSALWLRAYGSGRARWGGKLWTAHTHRGSRHGGGGLPGAT